MISVIKWIMFFVGILIGIVICQYVYRIPLKIEFKISVFSRFFFSVCLFFMIMAVMMLEIGLYEWILYVGRPQDWRFGLLYKFIENGVLVAVVIPLMSSFFGKTARKLNFDLSGAYSILFIKIYYSACIVANCLWLLLTYMDGFINNTPEAQCIFNRVIMWLLSVVGTWIGVGFHCESRIDEENRNIRRSKGTQNKKEMLEFFMPFIIAFIINCILLYIQSWKIEWIQNVFIIVYLLVFGIMISMLLLALIINYFTCPSTKRSDWKLSNAIREINKNRDDDEIIEHYENLRYHLIKDKGKKIIKIEKGNVEWPEHNERINEFLGEKEKEFDQFEYISCRNYLKEEREKRRKFNRNAFEECEKDREEYLRKMYEKGNV